MSYNLLDGVTVVAAELAEVGPVSTQILAFMGATVYHIERPVSFGAAMWPQPGNVLRNSCKKSVTINGKHEKGKELMWRLIEKADIFLENFAPTAWDRMGFSYEEVKKRNPSIIYVTVKGFSHFSPYANCVALDPVVASTGGSAALCGYEDDYPMLCGINIADSGTGFHIVPAILSALIERRKTGKGCFLEVPMNDTVVVQCRQAFIEYYEKGRVRRAGNTYKGLHPTAPWNVYPAQGQDRSGNYVAINCRPEPEYRDFEHLCAAMGREDLLSDPRYATPELRHQNHHELDREITKWTLRYTRREIMRVLGLKWKIPVGMVRNQAEIVNDEFLSNGEHIIHKVKDDLLEKDMYMPSTPLYFSDQKAFDPVTCGAFDSANEEIYCGVLGLSKDELKQLQKANAI